MRNKKQKKNSLDEKQVKWTFSSFKTVFQKWEIVEVGGHQVCLRIIYIFQFQLFFSFARRKYV